jgi:hypothetical protein
MWLTRLPKAWEGHLRSGLAGAKIILLHMIANNMVPCRHNITFIIPHSLIIGKHQVRISYKMNTIDNNDNKKTKYHDNEKSS